MDRNPHVKQRTWHESEPSENRFERVPLIPLDYGEELQNSHFSKDFENETLKLWMDNLNLLYVALTRPKHNLFVLADALPKNVKKGSTSTLRVSNLLHIVLNPLIDGVFQEGSLVPSIENEAETFDDNVFKTPLTNVEVPFSIATQQPMFYISDEARRWYQNRQTDFDKRALQATPLQSIHPTKK